MTASVAAHNAFGQIAAHDNRGAQRCNSQASFHSRVGGVPDDLVGESVLDATHVDLALSGPVLGGGTSRLWRNVGEQQLIGHIGLELVAGASVLIIGHSAQIVLDRRPGIAVLPPLRPDHLEFGTRRTSQLSTSHPPRTRE